MGRLTNIFQLFGSLTFMTVVLEILLNHINFRLVAKDAHKITIFRKFNSSQYFFDFRTLLRYFLRTYTFQYFYHLFNRILKRNSLRHVAMILWYLHFKHFTVPGIQSFFRKFLGCLSDLIVKIQLSIFIRPNNAVLSLTNCMTQSFYFRAADFTKNF